ncbi:50S ribosomal protein L9 [Dermacoccus nishinomiyaensis]|uniref:Large ribosomal subunit protein bL9 n=1 Tax=Dermacoccus nishinomiyaensis TaxID=1274 RepID=A0A075JII2_9MICO|nr:MULTISPECIES: 50S ribosomal protein L9 [Dermacoccus]HCQ18518.1 50S ribosomal protein L9 [Dermacoccus sp.]AIF39713.1 50S ribosomal protein L9 [Dermacoccus nishinomiyaensis]EFP58523.1 ribosomal protein L9 [Dermacoccus sp. Ellin185]MBO1758997.1 50S ribosomal protein L9 [Dermacoccus sp. NHGro5]MCG7429956.1 50S ribosomal protein L9 [Dermacoccus nishinomiyaensis]
MKVILTHEVSKLGTAGDVVDVKPGFARNYLLRNNLATEWTKGGQKQVDSITKARETRSIKTLEEAKSVKGNLENAKVTLKARAGENGRLFGAVTTGEIADAIKEAGAGSVDKRKIEITTPMRSLGEYSVLVRLHPEVQATVDVKVARA